MNILLGYLLEKLDARYVRGTVTTDESHTFTDVHVRGGGVSYHGTGASSVSSSNTHRVSRLVRIKGDDGKIEEIEIQFSDKNVIGIQQGDTLGFAFVDGILTHVVNITTGKIAALKEGLSAGLLGSAINFALFMTASFVIFKAEFIFPAAAIGTARYVVKSKLREKFKKHEQAFFSQIGWQPS